MVTPEQNEPEKKETEKKPFRQGDEVPPGTKDHLKGPWLEAYKKIRTITSTCKSFGLSRQTLMRWRKTDPAFNERFEEIDAELFETLEVNAYRRALEGSDTLMIFLLKAGNPKYRDHIRHEVDFRFVADVSAQVVGVIKRLVNDSCPNCKTHFGTVNKIAQELEGLSARLAPQ